MQLNTLLDKMRDGKPVFGPFCKLSDPVIYELIALAGFDFAIIDLEHGPMSYESAQNAVRVCELLGVSPVVRVSGNVEREIVRALDIGAHGIEVPEINNKEQAERLVRACRYYPQGNRGLCRFVRAAEYSRMERNKYFEFANKNVAIIAHLEGMEGIRNLDEILEVDGIDVLFIGPYDLSQSQGIPGQIEHPDLIKQMISISKKANEQNKAVGIFVESLEQASVWIQKGIRFIAYSVDVGLILHQFSSVVQGLKRE